MEKSKVYFTNFRTTSDENTQQKLARLMATAGMGDIDFEGKFVAIKMHFGEPGNLAFLRPNYAKSVADFVKSCGGKPFLVDCSTLYIGGRKNAIDHLDAATLNGFSPMTTGCQVIIADGLKGTDEALVPIEGGTYIQEAKIGRAVMDADIIISLSHFKGHECTGMGGSMKNLGMGCGSRAGKMEMHAGGKPHVNQAYCVGCGNCQAICAHEAPIMTDGKVFIDHEKCVGCGRCLCVCPTDAVETADFTSNDVLCCKIAEYSKAVVQGRPQFHITIANAISPNCDCHGENDAPIIPDLGMFASFDSVAIDLACTEMALKQPRLPNSLLIDRGDAQVTDHFNSLHPTTNWRVMIDHAKKIGLGNDQYQLIEI